MNRIIRPPIFILILMISLGPFSDTIYAPALPDIKKLLLTDFSHVQLTITSYLAGYAISQVLYGPLSDRFGRKKPMIVGSILFIIGSIVCIISTNIDTLIYARLLQGFGAAAGGVIATVAVKDSFELEEQGSVFAIMNIAFAIAPAMGALLGVFLSPNIIFWVLLIAAILLLVKVLLFFPETIAEKNLDAIKPKTFFKNYLNLFKDHQFFFATFTLGLNISVIYSCLAIIPDILENKLHLDKFKFIYLLAIMVTAVVIGSIACAKISKYIAYKHLINFGMLCILASGILCTYVFLHQSATELPISLTLILSLTFVGVAFTVPLLTPIALENFTKTAGAASSIMGFMQMGMAAITTGIISQLTLGSEFCLSFSFIILPLIGLFIFFPYSCYFLKK